MQLPYETWKMIVSYLPDRVVKELYPVNSALFNIAMDLRYQEARFSTGGPKALARKESRIFRYPHLSCRPKTLHLDLGSIAELLVQESSKTPLSRKFSHIVNLATRRKLGSVAQIIAACLDALPRLTAVTMLDVEHTHSGGCRDHPLILWLLNHVWQVFGDRLQSLQVRVAFENLELLLPTSLHLPCLESLTVHTQGFNTLAAITGESIFPTMVGSHASTLRTVSFTAGHAAVDPNSICRSLQDLSRLRGIHLSFPFGPSFPYPFPAYNVLYSCRRRLEFLSLEFGTYMGKHTSLFREDWCFVNLPCLRELRIQPPLEAFKWNFVEYIHRFSASLISLWIKQVVLDVSHIKQLGLIFCDFSSLRNLSIYVQVLYPKTLALLAQTLPRLQTLTLGYNSVSSGATPPTHRFFPHLFYQAMQLRFRLFHRWQLTSLDYVLKEEAWFHRTPDYTSYRDPPIKNALADHLPYVEWFRGVKRSTYMSHAAHELLPSVATDFVKSRKL